MQRHVWGGGSPGATVAAASPEGEGVNATDGWALSTNAIHLFATALAIVGALLHASLPPPTAEKVMSSHFSTPDATSARNYVSAFETVVGMGRATATDSARSRIRDFESGTAVNIGDAAAETSAARVSTGALDPDREAGSVVQARNGSAQEEARLHQLDGQHDRVYMRTAANDSDSRDCETSESGNSAAAYAGGAIASPTRRQSAAVAAYLSGGTH
jgi:hypothetical protein